jgi:hypothetical protein
MKFYIVLLIAFSLFTSSCASQDKKPAAGTETAAINLVFDKYTNALKTGKGNEALNYISQKTLDYYDTLIYHTLYSGEKELNKINILTRTAILRMRHTQPLAFWDTMSAKKLMVGMWNKAQQQTTSPQIALVNCETGNLQATCTIQIDGELTDMQFILNKENAEWKVDLTSILSKGIEEMKSAIEQRGLTETEYILLSIEKLENVSVSKENLYKPLKK